MRHLPRHYPGDSVYALFPFFTPPTMKANLTKLGLADQYANTDGARPTPLPIPKVVDTLDGIKYVFARPGQYANTYVKGTNLMTAGYGFMLSFDDETQCVSFFPVFIFLCVC